MELFSLHNCATHCLKIIFSFLTLSQLSFIYLCCISHLPLCMCVCISCECMCVYHIYLPISIYPSSYLSSSLLYIYLSTFQFMYVLSICSSVYYLSPHHLSTYLPNMSLYCLSAYISIIYPPTAIYLSYKIDFISLGSPH